MTPSAASFALWIGNPLNATSAATFQAFADTQVGGLSARLRDEFLIDFLEIRNAGSND
jgi:hypothetical protein